jgi:hypothetical protein
MLLLSDVEGVLRVDLAHELCLRVSYHIHYLSLSQIEEALDELGFHLDNSLLTKIKRALYYYTEENERQNLGCEKGQSSCTRKVFVNRYEQLPHGCRDVRPEHWRRYW